MTWDENIQVLGVGFSRRQSPSIENSLYLSSESKAHLVRQELLTVREKLFKPILNEFLLPDLIPAF